MGRLCLNTTFVNGISRKKVNEFKICKSQVDIIPGKKGVGSARLGGKGGRGAANRGHISKHITHT